MFVFLLRLGSGTKTQLDIVKKNMERLKNTAGKCPGYRCEWLMMNRLIAAENLTDFKKENTK